MTGTAAPAICPQALKKRVIDVDSASRAVSTQDAASIGSFQRIGEELAAEQRN